MPVYEYHCNTCGPFAELRPMSQHAVNQPCPSCGIDSKRVISAPNLSRVSRNTRIAHERNERSAHEPTRMNVAHKHTHEHKCGPSCQHSTKKNSRPWMLGH